MSRGRALLVATSVSRMPDGRATGVYASELVESWTVLAEHGFAITLGSPQGGPCPIEARRDQDEAQVRFFASHGGVACASTIALGSMRVSTTPWSLVLILGGHGAMVDLSTAPELARLVSRVHRRGDVVGAVCHGVAGLLHARAEDEPLLRGRNVAAFTDEEERAVGMIDTLPFLLSQRLSEVGAKHRPGPAFLPRVITDGRIVTGQNPASARATAQEACDAATDHDFANRLVT